MPTKPLETLLYRDLSVAAAKDIVDVDAPLLAEIVNYATNAFARCADSSTGAENEDVALFALYLHMIEMTDGIEVLISRSCAIPAMPLVRSSFETQLYMEYILEANYVQRSLAWLTNYVRQRIAMYESLDPSTPKGRNFEQAVNSDEAARSVKLPDPLDARRAKESLERMLERPQFRVIQTELRGLRKQKVRNPQWYRLFSGPKNLYELSGHLNRGAQYEVLYRQWSAVAHAADFSRVMGRNQDGKSTFNRLRDPGRSGDITVFAATFLLNATRKMLSKFHPGEDISGWYKLEVRERFLLVAKRSGGIGTS